ncbi:MAG: FG-GAP-like repeat-containing protein [Verrucomicrobia bacterium]|nr:FG-GAP-like repeat-containing protein [Verrucomicrobiota bacterium]
MVLLNNRISGLVDARVLLPDGSGAGAGWTAQLYIVPTNGGSAQFVPLFPATTFRTSSSEAAGYVTSVDVTVPETSPKDVVTLVLRAFNGESFETSDLRGESAGVTVTLGGGVTPPANLAGLVGFTIRENQPEPVEGGLLSFNNRVFGVVDARVLLADGSGAGPGWKAQLYAAVDGNLLSPLFPATTFRTSNEAAMGYVSPVDVAVPGTQPGDQATIVMTVYNGDSFESSTIAGQSNPIIVTLGGGTLPPANLAGLEGIVLLGEEPPRVEGGLISFNNRVIGVVDARVLVTDGSGAGEEWTAQLYGAAVGEPFIPLFPTTRFRTTSAATMGYVVPVDVVVPAVDPGKNATVVMTVFNGESFETSPLAGQSDAITITLGGGTLPPSNLTGMEGFTVTSDAPPAGNVGLVNFNNRITGVVDARVTLADGTGAGPGWKAQLYGAAEGETLVPLLAATTFRTTSAQAMGYVNPVVVSVHGVPPGGKATLMMTAFNGETYESSMLAGRSVPITVTLGGGTLPPTNLNGLQGFTIAGNPPVIFRQPASQSAVTGSTITLAVTASGEGALNYQWSFNRTAIRGANSTELTLSNLETAQAGLYTVAVSNAYGVVISAPAKLSVIGPAADGDFNNDGMADILFEDNNGSLAVWFMDGAKLQSGKFLNPIRTGDKKWRVSGLGDFNQDGNTDILFQHEGGTLSVWFMDGITRTSATFLDPADPGDKKWRVVAVNDFNKDGNPDIILQHEDGWIAIWYMDGIRLETAEFLQPNHPGDAKWIVVGSGDFNTDGKPDLAFQHQDGTLALWYLDGIHLTEATLLNPSLPNEAPWRVQSVMDLDRDGKPDLLFQHRGVGSIAVWYMDGDALRSAELLNPSRPGGTWEIVGP